MVETEDTISLPSPYVITYLSNSEWVNNNKLIDNQLKNVFRYTKFFSTHVDNIGRCPVWQATHTFNLENMVNIIKQTHVRV